MIMQCLVLDAVGVRVHCLICGIFYLIVYCEVGLRYDVVDFLDGVSGLVFFESWIGIICIFIWFEDDVYLVRGFFCCLDVFDFDQDGFRVMIFYFVLFGFNVFSVVCYQSFKVVFVVFGIVFFDVIEVDFVFYWDIEGVVDFFWEVCFFFVIYFEQIGGLFCSFLCD